MPVRKARAKKKEVPIQGMASKTGWRAGYKASRGLGKNFSSTLIDVVLELLPQERGS